MPHQSQAVDVAFEQFLRELPSEYAEMAYEFKAFTRARKIKTPAQLMQVVMLYCGLDQALRTTAGSFTLLEERITETAIHQRLQACGPWLKALLQKMLPATKTVMSERRLLVIDGTSLQGPGAQSTDYRVHLVLDLTHMVMHAVDVSGTDGAERLTRHPWQAGDIVLADRGYNHPQAILDLGERDVAVIVRLNPTAMPLVARTPEECALAPDAERLNLASQLRECPDDTLSLAVWLRAQKASGPGWVHAVRLPPEAAEAARRRCRTTARRKGRTPSEDTLFLNGWVMVFTTVPPATLAGATVLELYRCRWQIELAFKRLKSLLDLDALRTQQQSRLGEVWILGKLLDALVIETHLNRHAKPDWNRLDQPRRGTPWRLLKIIRQQVESWILDPQRQRVAHWEACCDVLQERPRRRRLQRLPERVIGMLHGLESQQCA
jgi:hypothetical protein